jgi:predicted enzyme related to lactoylglutathione lyase
MEQVTHAPGTFCWPELATSDAEGAKKFYTELMGWTTHDDPIPEGGAYTMILKGDGYVGGIFKLTDEMTKQGVPPNWLSYVTVESAAETAKQAASLGGQVLRDAFDVMDIGRMAVLQDPTGAVFAVWEPIKHHGTHFTGAQLFTLCWNELATNDADKATEFYTSLLPWQAKVQDMGPVPYTMFEIGETSAGGMMQMTEEWGNIPPHWMVYFAVDDCDARCERAKSLGAEIKVPPTDIPPVGRFCVIQDPQGAMFSIITLSNQGGA